MPAGQLKSAFEKMMAYDNVPIKPKTFKVGRPQPAQPAAAPHTNHLASTATSRLTDCSRRLLLLHFRVILRQFSERLLVITTMSTAELLPEFVQPPAERGTRRRDVGGVRTAGPQSAAGSGSGSGSGSGTTAGRED